LGETRRELTLTKPQSTTYLIPSIVTLASAILVEKMTFLVSRGGGSKTISCSSVGRPACSGNGNSFGAAFGILLAVSDIQASNKIGTYDGIRSDTCCKT